MAKRKRCPGAAGPRLPEQQGAGFISDRVHGRPRGQPDVPSLFDDLRAISERSAARLEGRALLTDADLYGEDGLPA